MSEVTHTPEDVTVRQARYHRRSRLIPGIWLPAILVDPLRRCTHSAFRVIGGDEIIAANFRRKRCLDCGRLGNWS